MRFSFLAACGLIAATLTLPAQGALRAWLDQNTIASGETVQLNLAHDGQGSSTPDLSVLQQDFDILGRSRSSNVQIINGKISSQVQVQLTLSPKHEGKITIPPITWDGDKSTALTLNVGHTAGSPGNDGQSGNTSGASTPGVFLEDELDNHQPYVQAAVHLKVRLYTSKKLFDASLDLPDTKDMLVQQIGKDQQSDATRNGRQYHVIERDYLLFPQRSGKLSLPGPILDGKIMQPTGAANGLDDIFNQAMFNGMGNVRPIRLHGKNIELDVRPRPANANGSYWLPARAVSLQEDWTPKDLAGHTGDPISLKLTLKARDLTAAQLPDLSAMLDLPAGLKAYPDTAKLDNSPQGDSIQGTRTQNIALIADRPGLYSLPAIHLQWWDTAANALREVSVPSRKITITGAVNTANAGAGSSAPQSSEATLTTAPVSSSPAAPASDKAPGIVTVHDRLWQWISLGLAILWLLTLGLWGWSSRKRYTSQPRAAHTATTTRSMKKVDDSAAHAAFIQACQAGNAGEARRQLLAWASAHWQDNPPAGVLAVARRLGPEAAGQIRELDRACNLDLPWEGSDLLSTLPQLPATPKQIDNQSELEPLYS